MRKLIWSLSHSDDLTIVSISSVWLNYCPYLIRVTSLWAVSHPDDLIIGNISYEWLNYSEYLFRMTYWHCSMPYGWLSWSWYLIGMTNGHVIMSSGWHTLLFLSHPNEIANFDFLQHAVAFKRLRFILPSYLGIFLPNASVVSLRNVSKCSTLIIVTHENKAQRQSARCTLPRWSCTYRQKGCEGG